MKEHRLVNKIFNAMLIPTILMNLVTCVSSAADTVIVGNLLGEEALAAITFSMPVYMIINTLASLIAVGGTTALGNALGRGEKETANGIFGASIVFAFFISILFAVTGVAFVGFAVNILGAQGDIAGLTKDYVIVVFGMTPAFILNITLAFFARSDGRPNLAMYGMVTSIIANIILDIVFIAYLKMGIAGAAWATGTSQIISALMVLTHFAGKRCGLRFIIKRPFEKIRLIFKSGVGTSLHFVYQFITILIFNNLIMHISGDDGIVVYTVVINVATIALSVFEGLSQTVQPMFSVYYGENNHTDIKETLKLAMWMTLILGGGVTVFLELFPYLLIRAFGVTSPQLISDSAAAIRIFSVSIAVQTLNAVMGYYYQSTENNGLAAAIVMSRNLVMLLLGAFIFSNLFGTNGIWSAYIFAEITTIALWVSYASYKGRQSGKGLLLLPPEGIVYTSRITDADKDAEVLAELKEFLSKNGVDNETGNKTAAAVSELLNCAKKAGSGLTRAEIRAALGDKVCLTIRDNGKAIDAINLESVKTSGTGFEYDSVLGVNRLTVNFEKG